MFKRLKTFYQFLQLLLLNLKSSIANLWEFIKVAFKYYPKWTFFKIDSSLLFSYAFDNPFKVSKRFLLKKGESEIYTYGETPLTTLDYIARKCGLTKKDVVFELGCGRGRTCFWLNQFIGCKVVGIEYIPEFIERALKIKEKFNLKEVDFRLEDFLQTDLTGATVIYLYGTCLPDQTIIQLIEKFKNVPKGTKIITVSYSLTDYSSHNSFKVVMTFPATFTWGQGIVYVHIKC